LDSDLIATRIFTIRTDAGMTQKEFAKAIGVPFRNLQNYEGAKIENIPHTFMYALCKKFKINANWLLLGEGAQYASSENPLQSYFQDKMDILMSVCTNLEEYDQAIERIFVHIETTSEKIITNKLITNLLVLEKDTPILQPIISWVSYNGIGATIALFTIFAKSTKNFEEQKAKSSFLEYCEFGHFTTQQSTSTKLTLYKAINDLDESTCEYLYSHQDSFLSALTTLKRMAADAIEKNQNFEEIVQKIIEFFINS
jgi:transcriptional regulator with XRE-family HTH domain